MKISYTWLREFLPDLGLSAEELAKRLLLLGFEVSELREIGPGFSGVVVGEILEVRKHPNADRLSLCSVDSGKDKLSIVCGASNVAVGARVPVALVGAVLAGGRKIEKSKIRGESSQGMICSAAELGLAGKNGEGILILPSDSPVGEDASRILGESDRVLEVEVTPNRPDCLSHYGLARELAIHLACGLKSPMTELSRSSIDDGARPRRVDIQDADACRRYIGREFKELTVGPSPSWMVRRLDAVGLRSINNLVDITNYVLLELGHPTHAFDADKLQGGAITARFAKDGERIAALDGRVYALSASDLAIADASGPVAIGGVIGGEPTSVTEKTRNAFLEAACFKPGLVRATSKRLRLRTESSYRFERGSDPETAALACTRATELILRLCRGKAGPVGDAYPRPSRPAPIEASPDGINRMLGTDFPEEKIRSLLGRISASQSEPFQPPSHRLDLRTPSDLAEEVGRHLGYDSIPSTAAPVQFQAPRSSAIAELIAKASDRLAAQGFYEAYNVDFVSAAQMTRCGTAPDASRDIAVLNPLSEDYAYLRSTLLIGLLQSASYNLSRGARGLRLFEAGHVYAAHDDRTQEKTQLAGLMVGDFPVGAHWRADKTPTDFYDAKGALEDLLRPYPGIVFSSQRSSSALVERLFHPQASAAVAISGRPLGIVGMIHPRIAKAWDFGDFPAAAFVIEDLSLLAEHPPVPARMAPISPYPSITRDLSVVLDSETPYAAVRGALASLENLSGLDLIDVYAGKGVPEGKKSLTLRLAFSRLDRTLRDEEAAKTVDEALALLAARFKAKLRS